MNQSTPREEFREATLSQVTAEVDHLLELSKSDEAADNLLSLGLHLVDLGRAFALDPVFAAIDRLRLESRVREVDEGWCAMLQGLVAFHRGQLEPARRYFDEAVGIGAALEDQALIANGYQNIGLVSWMAGSLNDAETDFIASNKHRPLSDTEGYAKVLVNLASLYLDRGDMDRFARTLDELAASPAIGRRGADRSALLGLQGVLAVQDGRLQDAERLLRAATVMARRLGVVSHEIVNLQNLGSVRVDLKKPGRALRPLRRATRLAWLTDDYRNLEVAQRTLATALVHAGRFRDAIAELSDADAVAVGREDRLSSARISADLGALYLMWKKPTEAVEALRLALEAFIPARDHVWGPKTALNLGLAIGRTGRPDDALRIVREAGVELLDDPSDVGDLLETLGDAVLGEWPSPECAKVFEAAAEAYATHPMRGLADNLAEMASKLAESGMSDEAVRFFNEALLRHDPNNCHTARYQILNDRGLAKAATGDIEAAIVDLRESLALATGGQDRAMRSLCLNNLSEMTRRLGGMDEALEFALEAVSESRGLQGQMQIGGSVATLGLAQLGLDDLEGATASFKEGLRLARRTRDRSTEAISLGGLGQVAFDKGRFPAAIRYFLRAVDIESEDSDPTHETETWASLAETAARLNDKDRFESYLQHLIDTVQKKKGPLATALDGIRRAGTSWLEAGDLEAAGGVFATGILIAAAESVQRDEEQFASALGRAVLIPFFATANAGGDSVDLERFMRAELRRHLGKSSRVIESLFPIAKDAVAEALMASP
jgi:tetratricopeptide (TPR) repeat protein